MGCTSDKDIQLPRITGSNQGAMEALPFVVISERIVDDKYETRDYLDAFGEASNYVFNNVEGVKCFINNVDNKNPKMVHDIQWFWDFNTFMKHADMNNPEIKRTYMAWLSKNDPSVKL